MSEYSNYDAYLLRERIWYRPETHHTPVGNSSRHPPRRDIMYPPPPPPVTNPYDATRQLGAGTCFLPAPVTWMETAPYDPRSGRFVDTYFYKTQRFAPGSN